MLSAAYIATLVPHDKALHFIAGALCALAGLFGAHLLGEPTVSIALVVCAVVAAAREWLNASGWSWSDLVWTLAGGVLVVAAAWIGA